MLASKPGQGDCCCEELRMLFQVKEKRMDDIARAWKSKANELATTYYEALRVMREQQADLKMQTHVQLSQLRNFQECMAAEVA